MALTTAVLQGGVALGTTPAALYTVPAGKTAWVKNAVLTNTSVSPTQITVSITRAGGAPVIIIAARTLAAGEAYIARELVGSLNPGDAINAAAGASGVVNAFISGLVS